jgi:predicted nuclease with TOPRIM domain
MVVMFEILKTEESFFEKLSENEKRIYTANNEQLALIDTVNDYTVRQYVEVSRLMNELHRIHQRYNDLTDILDNMQTNTDEKQKEYDQLYTVNEDLFVMNMAIGNFSSIITLTCMDECDALYGYLSLVKMSRFDWMLDDFEIDKLIAKL